MAAQFIPGPGDSPQGNIGVQFSEALAKGMSLGLEAQRQQVLNQMAQQEMAFKAQQQPLVLAKQQLDFNQATQANPLLIQGLLQQNEKSSAETKQLQEAAQLYQKHGALVQKQIGTWDATQAAASAEAASRAALMNTDKAVKDLSMGFMADQAYGQLSLQQSQADQLRAHTQAILQENERAKQLYSFQNQQQRLGLADQLTGMIKNAPPNMRDSLNSFTKPTQQWLGMELPSQLGPTTPDEALNQDFLNAYPNLSPSAKSRLFTKVRGLTTPQMEQGQDMLGTSNPTEQDLMQAFEKTARNSKVFKKSASATQPATQTSADQTDEDTTSVSPAFGQLDTFISGLTQQQRNSTLSDYPNNYAPVMNKAPGLGGIRSYNNWDEQQGGDTQDLSGDSSRNTIPPMYPNISRKQGSNTTTIPAIKSAIQLDDPKATVPQHALYQTAVNEVLDAEETKNQNPAVVLNAVALKYGDRMTSKQTQQLLKLSRTFGWKLSAAAEAKLK